MLFRSALAERAERVGRTVQATTAREGTAETALATNGGEAALEEPSMVVFGVAYKPNTDDVRSSAIETCISLLRSAGVSLAAYDPHVENATIERQFNIDAQEELSFEGFDAALIMTPHREITEYDLEGIRSELGDQPVVADPHAVFRHEGTDSRHAFEYVTL